MLGGKPWQELRRKQPGTPHVLQGLGFLCSCMHVLHLHVASSCVPCSFTYPAAPPPRPPHPSSSGAARSMARTPCSPHFSMLHCSKRGALSPYAFTPHFLLLITQRRKVGAAACGRRGGGTRQGRVGCWRGGGASKMQPLAEGGRDEGPADCRRPATPHASPPCACPHPTHLTPPR